MNVLEIPALLKGDWEHAVFVTYGFDAPFFENALWGVLPKRCRNNIILADRDHFLEACQNYANNQLVRFFNTRYVVDGVTSPHAAHAKLILLTNETSGRLLIGSGNLNMQGYASGGELFTHYEYSPEETTQLLAFQAALEFLRQLAENHTNAHVVRSRLQYLEEHTSWLFSQTDPDAWQPVHHNLIRPLLDQFVEAVDDEPVEELWIMSPFYDERVKAFTQMLQRLRPRKLFLLIQSGYTSVDKQQLIEALAQFSGEVEVMGMAALADTSPYYHAKLYCAVLADKAICLQGSPNLSQVALLRSASSGNIELANLLVGGRDLCNTVWDGLQLSPVSLEDEAIELSFSGSEKQQGHLDHVDYKLLGGELTNEKQLRLYIDGQFPKLESAYLAVSQELIPLSIHKTNPKQLLIQLTEEQMGLFERPVPVWIQWGANEDEAEHSNAVFVCHRPKLDAEIANQGTVGQPDKFGGLQAEDEDLEPLLSELESTMVLDSRSIWQLANRQPTQVTAAVEADDDTQIRYEDVDYEMLRKHPRLRQYYELRGVGQALSGRSRLQILMSSITDHFGSLVSGVSNNTSKISITQPLENEAETEEEREQEAREQEALRRRLDHRLRHIFRHFIRRYLKGIQQKRFQELVGPEVIGTNYAIFSHLLWQLAFKEWFSGDTEFWLDAVLQNWRFFWGDENSEGYLATLHERDQADLLETLQEYKPEAHIIASIFHGEKLTLQNTTYRIRLRDSLSYLLQTQILSTSQGLLVDTWYLLSEKYPGNPPRPSRIVANLQRLADFRTNEEFLRQLYARYGQGTCSFDSTVKVYNYPDRVKCLFINSEGILTTAQEAIDLLRKWMAYEELPYYRIEVKAGDAKERLIYYNARQKSGLFYDFETGNEKSFEEITAEVGSIGMTLAKFSELAELVDNEMSFSGIAESNVSEPKVRRQEHK
ncbi:MAG: hypothetical protein KDE51_24935 [Anaerolineales bacterium]|nr:hypothetical protein [Anaerolineales bacterium]